MKKYIGIVGLLSLTALGGCGTALDFWSDEEPKMTGPRKTPMLNSGGMPPQQMGIMPGDPMMNPMMQPPAPPIDAMAMPSTPPSYARPIIAQNPYPPTPLPTNRRPPQFNQQALGMKDMPMAAPVAEVGQSQLADANSGALPDAELSAVPLPPPPPAGMADQQVSNIDRDFPLPAPQAQGEIMPIEPMNSAPATDEQGYPRLASMPPAPPAPVPVSEDVRADQLKQELAYAKKETVSMGGGSKIIVTKPMDPDAPPPVKNTPSIPPMPPLAQERRMEAQHDMMAHAPIDSSASYQPQFMGSGPSNPSVGVMPEGPTIVVRSNRSGGAPAPEPVYEQQAMYAPAPVMSQPAPMMAPPPAPMPPAPPAEYVAVPPPPAPALAPIQPITSQPQPIPMRDVQPMSPVATSMDGAPSTSLSDLRPLSSGPVVNNGPIRYTNPVLPDSRYARLRSKVRKSAQY